MVDKFQALNFPKITTPDQQVRPGRTDPQAPQGKDFKSLLLDSINEVNRLQAEAEQARIDLATGKSENVAEVFTAVKKAELAFQTLMQIRNKLVDAYEEIKQMRV